MRVTAPNGDVFEVDQSRERLEVTYGHRNPLEQYRRFVLIGQPTGHRINGQPVSEDDFRRRAAAAFGWQGSAGSVEDR